MHIQDLFIMIQEILGKKLRINYEDCPENTHYLVTPYSFMPKTGRKMFPALATDLGQGLLRVMSDIHERRMENSAPLSACPGRK